MKYIKTKNEIYKVVLMSPLGFVRIDKRDGTFPDIFEKDIIKKADTIEELCDCVVTMNELCDTPITKNLLHELGNDKHIIKNSLYQIKQGQHGKWWLKLAIWTDKGLIYVAKMNEDGKLCLL